MFLFNSIDEPKYSLNEIFIQLFKLSVTNRLLLFSLSWKLFLWTSKFTDYVNQIDYLFYLYLAQIFYNVFYILTVYIFVYNISLRCIDQQFIKSRSINNFLFVLFFEK